ncbi:1-acyl-sn-glycerol-3-phosphate acyltransferase 1, chloroplastic-like isoform X1 [Vigna unguiculata]|uniref:1-acyl-sn-glycerol-3-phosphate acyltransferase 1, chloroplastic-like isoform X1 n=1 Tax=Vigna unguiculata TaxID=3917 RepID=UPI001016B034|nr:1-acyl-sn-glycerol-3-phosphate acyltransferase 1, chloroplastic-like isoform X1 [Vigna unguiculata]XP_027934163.1 1-acyl-sn-glycerol-3-phosphate acyltransferase 1, chloroplastic-like isoform X1 [Vigna unguiculata]XP_027934164.1 1-acyl-sn-glycerol-3-phosphate acyltransferase 1, chloroplastic-like isoform X1 [Vigna unguiculata]
MEITLLSSPSPIHHPPQLGHKKARFFAGSSSTLLCTHRGTTTYNHPILRISHKAPQCCMQGISKKLGNVSWLFVSPKFLVQNKLSRDVVVRSELTAAGSAEDGYLLPELKVESKVRGACFYAVTAFSAIFLFVLMMVGHPLVLLFDRYRRKFHHFIAKVWATLTVAPFFKIEFEGMENLPPPDTPAVYVSNHQSFLDIYTLLTLGRSFKFISKTGIFLFPIIGWAMFFLGVIPLKRMDSRSQLDCLKRCMDLIKKGASVFFFPEGTRSKDGKLGTFKKGAFSVAAKTNAPLVPITLIGTGQIMPAGKEGILNIGSVKVVIHKPIFGKESDVLCKEARMAIASVLTQS